MNISVILITGATGHTGLFLLEELFREKNDYKIKCIVRKESFGIEKLKKFPVEIVCGDMQDEESLRSAMNGVDTVIHIVNIKYSPVIIRLAEEAKVKRVILIHTTGMYSKYRDLAQDYIEIENNIVQNTKLEYVILRPTMIYGTEMDHNMHKLIQYIKNHNVFPVFGNGKNLIQPVFVGDLAKSIAQVLENTNIKNKGYTISGKNALEYREILRIIAKKVNPSIRLIFIPFYISIILGMTYNFLCNIIGKKGEISVEQIRRLCENKDYGHEDAKKDFGYSPISFEEGIDYEIRSMGL